MNTETQNKITELIIQESMNALNENINTSLDEFKTSVEARIDDIKTAAYADIKTLESYITVEKHLVVNVGTVEAPKKKLVHKSFQTIIKILSSTKRKEKNIMLVGGAGGGKYAQLIKVPTEFLTMSVVAYSCTCDFYRVVTWLLTAIQAKDKDYTGNSSAEASDEIIEAIEKRGDLYIGGGFTEGRFGHCSKEEAEEIVMEYYDKFLARKGGELCQK